MGEISVVNARANLVMNKSPHFNSENFYYLKDKNS